MTLEGVDITLIISDFNLLVRELANGIWAVSSTILLLIILNYIRGQMQTEYRWWRNPGVQVAGALSVMMGGHLIRALAQWIQFLYVNSSQDPGLWGHWGVFVVATICIIIGKLLCIYALVPSHWHWRLMIGTVVLALGIPAAVAWLV